MGIDPWVAGSMAALAPLIAMLSALINPLFSRLSRKPWRTSFIFSEVILLINAYLTFTVAYYVFEKGDVLVYMFSGFPPPIGIAYEIDRLNSFVGLLIGLIFPVINITSYRYLGEVVRRSEWYYTLLLGLEAGLLGMVYTSDLFNLFVMLSLTCIVAYAYTAYPRKHGGSPDTVIKYGLIGTVGLVMYFIAVILLYSGLGTLSMADIASKTLGLNIFHTMGIAIDTKSVLTLFLALAIWAIMIEAAIFPHHFWLPDTYSSMPLVVTALMAGVVEAVYAYVMIRLIYTVVGLEYSRTILYILLILGSLNIVVGGYLTAIAKDIRRLIAYTTILDMGYIVIGIGIGSTLGLSATLYYILCHAIVKPLLFISITPLEMAGLTSVERVAGVARKEPFIGLGLIVGGLSVIGIPPFNIFFARLRLFQAVLEARLYPVVPVLILGSILALVGFKRLWLSMYRSMDRDVEHRIKALPETIFTISLLVVATVVSGILFTMLETHLLNPISAYMLSGDGRRMYVEKAYELFKLIYSR